MIGWIVGIALVWLSKTWLAWEKWVATLTPFAAVALTGLIAALTLDLQTGGFPGMRGMFLLAILVNVDRRHLAALAGAGPHEAGARAIEALCAPAGHECPRARGYEVSGLRAHLCLRTSCAVCLRTSCAFPLLGGSCPIPNAPARKSVSSSRHGRMMLPAARLPRSVRNTGSRDPGSGRFARPPKRTEWSGRWNPVQRGLRQVRIAPPMTWSGWR